MNLSRRIFIFQDKQIIFPGKDLGESLLRGTEEEAFKADFSPMPEGTELYGAPHIGGEGTIATALLPPGAPIPPRWEALPVRQVLRYLSGPILSGGGEAADLFRAWHLVQWRRDSRYCGSCGAPNQDDPLQVCRVCPRCGRIEFPRITPAIIVLITNGEGQVLLAHNASFAPGVYSLIAGFNEAGENLEATVTREVQEEVGLRVKDIRYIASQPWPFPASLMVGYSAVFSGGDIHCDGKEILDARWFAKDELPRLPGNGSVGRYLLDLWQEGAL